MKINFDSRRSVWNSSVVNEGGKRERGWRSKRRREEGDRIFKERKRPKVCTRPALLGKRFALPPPFSFFSSSRAATDSSFSGRPQFTVIIIFIFLIHLSRYSSSRAFPFFPPFFFFHFRARRFHLHTFLSCENNVFQLINQRFAVITCCFFERLRISFFSFLKILSYCTLHRSIWLFSILKLTIVRMFYRCTAHRSHNVSFKGLCYITLLLLYSILTSFFSLTFLLFPNSISTTKWIQLKFNKSVRIKISQL